MHLTPATPGNPPPPKLLIELAARQGLRLFDVKPRFLHPKSLAVDAMVLCSLPVDSSASGDSVTDSPFRPLGLNQQSYDRLKTALNLGLRRQVFIAVCDDLLLRDRLAVQLQAELAQTETALLRISQAAEPRVMPRLVTLELELHDPNPLAQVVDWLSYFPASRQRSRVPTFQILGIERLTRQSAALQSLFLSYLQEIEQALPAIESGLLLWMTQPWFRMLPEAVPEFWHCRTGVFEFSGDPTPLPATPERIHPGPSSQPLPPAPAENPWLALADSLALWYEPEAEPNQEQPEDLPEDQAEDQAENWAENQADPDPAGDLPDFSQWIAALSPEPSENAVGANCAVAEDQARIGALTIVNSLAASQPMDSTQLADLAKLADLPLEELLNASAFDLADDLAQALVRSTADGSDRDPDGAQGNAEQNTEQNDQVAESGTLWAHIGLLQQQLALLQTGQESPQAMAMAYRTLGNFYRDCIEQGDASAENLAMAVQAYEQACSWLPTEQQAELLNDLGNLYWMVAQTQTQSDQILACLLQTVQTYQQALEHLDLEQPQQVSISSMVQNNLGAVYADLAHYQDPVDCLQRSVVAYQTALAQRPAEQDPLRYASTQNNLGTTYWNLAQHQQPELNLKQAILAYSEAQRYSDPAQEPIYYAMIQNNLGTAYWNLSQYEPVLDYLLAALTAYRSALQYRTLEATPAGFAATQNNLGTAYWHLANQTHTAERLTYLNEAVAAYELTLKAADQLQATQPQTALNFDLAATHNNLGLAHYQIALDPGTAAVAPHLEAALQHHLSALQAWQHQPDLRQTALHYLVQTLRVVYSQLGLSGQNQALAKIPGDLLAEILPQL